jgi:hypothetical protein
MIIAGIATIMVPGFVGAGAASAASNDHICLQYDGIYCIHADGLNNPVESQTTGSTTNFEPINCSDHSDQGIGICQYAQADTSLCLQWFPAKGYVGMATCTLNFKSTQWWTPTYVTSTKIAMVSSYNGGCLDAPDVAGTVVVDACHQGSTQFWTEARG